MLLALGSMWCVFFLARNFVVADIIHSFCPHIPSTWPVHRWFCHSIPEKFSKLGF